LDEDVLEEFINTIQLIVFTLPYNQHAPRSKDHEGNLSIFQMIFTLNAWVTTWVITTFDLVFCLENDKQFLAIDVVITAKIRIDEDGLPPCLE
jgi:hypothetical protein